jgi:mRNA interferase RelE/StbE
VTRYALLIEPDAHQERKRLPGHVRQRIRQTFDDLAEDPRPPHSQSLDVAGLDVPPGVEVRRLRIQQWRVIYALNNDEHWVWILAVRQRPPYNYEGLDDLIAKLE